MKNNERPSIGALSLDPPSYRRHGGQGLCVGVQGQGICASFTSSQTNSCQSPPSLGNNSRAGLLPNQTCRCVVSVYLFSSSLSSAVHLYWNHAFTCTLAGLSCQGRQSLSCICNDLSGHLLGLSCQGRHSFLVWYLLLVSGIWYLVACIWYLVSGIL